MGLFSELVSHPPKRNTVVSVSALNSAPFCFDPIP